MIKTRLFSIIAFLLLSLFLSTKPSLADPLYDQCMAELPNGATMDFVACGQQYYERLDKQLNATWKTILTSYDEHPNTKEIRNSLVIEQREWLNYRKNACANYWNNYSGSMHWHLTAQFAKPNFLMTG